MTHRSNTREHAEPEAHFDGPRVLFFYDFCFRQDQQDGQDESGSMGVAMQSMFARTSAQICGTRNAWKVAEETDSTAHTEEREVQLEIQGDQTNGYHLVMSPEGCFTADSWHQNLDEALKTAMDLFDVSPTEWKSHT